MPTTLNALRRTAAIWALATAMVSDTGVLSDARAKE